MYFSSSSNAKVGPFKMFSLKKIKIAFYLSSTKASVHQRSKAQSFLQTTQKAKKKNGHRKDGKLHMMRKQK